MKRWMLLQVAALFRAGHELLGGWMQPTENPQLSWEASVQQDDNVCRVVWVLKD